MVPWKPLPLFCMLAVAILGGRAATEATDSPTTVTPAPTCCSSVLVGNHGAGGMGGYFHLMRLTDAFDSEIPM